MESWEDRVISAIGEFRPEVVIREWVDVCEDGTVASIKGDIEELVEISESPCSHSKCSRSDSVRDVSVDDMIKEVAD